MEVTVDLPRKGFFSQGLRALGELATQVSWKSGPGRAPLAAKYGRENMLEGFRETRVAGAGWMRVGSEGAMVLWVTLRTSYGFYSEEV